MKVVKDRPIIITDPCYIARDEDWDDENGSVFNWRTSTINSPIFSSYIWEDTKVGDGQWSVFEVNQKLGEGELEDTVDDYSLALNEENEELLEKIESEQKQIGTFTADSGCIGVFFLDEALKYNPDFLTGLSNICYTIIRDFTGRIQEYECANDDYTHFLGIGNKTFYTI